MLSPNTRAFQRFVRNLSGQKGIAHIFKQPSVPMILQNSMESNQVPFIASFQIPLNIGRIPNCAAID